MTRRWRHIVFSIVFLQFLIVGWIFLKEVDSALLRYIDGRFLLLVALALAGYNVLNYFLGNTSELEQAEIITQLEREMSDQEVVIVNKQNGRVQKIGLSDWEEIIRNGGESNFDVVLKKADG